MIEQLGCVPGAVCPIGLPEHVIIIVDTALYRHEELLYTLVHEAGHNLELDHSNMLRYAKEPLGAPTEVPRSFEYGDANCTMG